jgi:hypothetical protein
MDTNQTVIARGEVKKTESEENSNRASLETADDKIIGAGLPGKRVAK